MVQLPKAMSEWLKWKKDGGEEKLETEKAALQVKKEQLQRAAEKAAAEGDEDAMEVDADAEIAELEAKLVAGVPKQPQQSEYRSMVWLK